jgi:hypothetical protein
MLYDDRQTGPFSTAAMTGFVQIAVIPTFGYYSIVVGRKPGGRSVGRSVRMESDAGPGRRACPRRSHLDLGAEPV